MIEMLLSTVLEGKEELEQSDQGFSVPPECNQSKLFGLSKSDDRIASRDHHSNNLCANMHGSITPNNNILHNFGCCIDKK